MNKELQEVLKGISDELGIEEVSAKNNKDLLKALAFAESRIIVLAAMLRDMEEEQMSD